MIKGINVDVSIILPKLNKQNKKAKELSYNLFLSECDENKIEKEVDTFLKETLENIEEEMEENIDYITKENYNKLSQEERKKYYSFEGNFGEYYILNPIINVDTENESYPETMEEHMSDVGMSWKDFI